MRISSTSLLKAVLYALYYSGLARVFAPVARGRGVIFMLHQVGPMDEAAFSPNRILKVTPNFLEGVIKLVKRAGFDIISMDEVQKRLRDGDADQARPFACFTLDDGYLDNIDHAYPVFKRHNVPFTIYLPTAFADGEGDLWWLVLQNAIAQGAHISTKIDGAPRSFDIRTTEEKDAAFAEIYWWLRVQPEHHARAVVKAIADQVGYDPSPLCSDLVMTWDQARALGEDPLVTFGGHTCAHFALAKLSAQDARREIIDGNARLERELGKPCRHFAYPYGDEGSAGQREFDLVAALGLETAVTTQKGHIQAEHRSQLTALPRISLNGDYQDLRFVDVFLSGVPFALWRGLGNILKMLRRFRSSKAPVNAGEHRPA